MAPYNDEMKLTLQMKLLPTVEQSVVLIDTMRIFNEAATFAARLAFDARVFSKPSVHRLAYFAIRKKFKLSAQLAIHAMLKAVNCFSRDKTSCPAFRPDGAITYDERNMGFKGVDKVSLSTLQGRQIVSMIYGEYQAERFDRIKGQCDLVRRGEKFYLIATVDLPEPTPMKVKDFVGVDLGVVVLATTDDGETFSGKSLEKHRRRRSRARKTYQKKHTRSARRRLRQMAGRQARFQRDANHVVSKKIVAKALASQAGIAVEELTGIRTTCEKTVRREQRGKLSNWSFHQLRTFLTYKAKLVGVQLIAVDARNTSRECSECGHSEKANRKSQAEFLCKRCGFSCNADQNGAKNIRLRALGLSVNKPELVAVPA